MTHTADALKVASIHPSCAASHSTDGADDALAQFSQMSAQLSSSYRALEQRVADLNDELIEVTQQRLDELAEKERLANRLQGLLSVLPGGVVVLDSSGRVRECNPAALDLLGEPLEGELWREVIQRSFAPRQDDGHEISLHDGRRISIATRNQGSDGQIILLTDQTETRRLQSELSRHERLSALGQMVSALAHQIRTPLSAAMLYCGHLRNEQLPLEQRRQFSEKVANRLTHMERQVQDMLLFVKGELPISDRISVAQLQEELAEAMEVPLLTSNSQVSWDLGGEGYQLACNRDALVGALLNLVNNAIQAVGHKAALSISLQPQQWAGEHWLAIEIQDNGPGISPELLPRVNELFVTTKSQGTGLGLAVVNTVARAHGGRFHLHSADGEGARALLLLPAVAPANPNA